MREVDGVHSACFGLQRKLWVAREDHQSDFLASGNDLIVGLQGKCI